MSKGKLLAVCVIWLVIAAALAGVWPLVIQPNRRNEIFSETGSSSNYRHQVDLAIDSFSGYCILRSPEFAQQTAAKRIRVNLVDDNADYHQRLESLRRGDVQMAVFTIDALLKTSAQLGNSPATIVAIVDETRGADAMVAYKTAIPNVDALNRSDVKFVLTPDSPSETLARVVMTQFNLDNLGPEPFVMAGDADNVYKRYRSSKPDTPQVFVLWEPYVSKVLENPNTHVVIDSSRFRGYIVDVLVANRDFLLKNEDVVRDLVGCYFRAAYHYRDGMVELVLADAAQTGAPLTDKQAENLVRGIWWKNTQENFAHFGFSAGQSLQLLEDIVRNINKVLISTKAMTRDPTDGQPTTIFYDKILRDLEAADFHPGLAQETVRDDRIELAALSDKQWDTLIEVGEVEVPKLVFPRGTATLTRRSQVVLDELVQSLRNWPHYYLLIRGDALREGDPEVNKANTALAKTRAEAAEEYLIQAGIDEKRVKAVGIEPSGASSVTFMLGQLPY